MPEKTKWTPKMDTLLGTMSSGDVAGKLGIHSKGVVGRRRRELGIPAFQPITQWTPKMDTLLGTESDYKIADLLGIKRGVVRHRRYVLGIPSCNPKGPKVKWTPEREMILGTMTDYQAAQDLGLNSLYASRRRRLDLGIPSWSAQNRIIPKELTRQDPEANRIYSARRKSRKLGLANTLTWEQWQHACEWFNHRCAYCREETTFLTEDHLIPVSKGGPRTALNMIPACLSCNLQKHATRAYHWIYWKFGKDKGNEIITNIVAYLTEVKSEQP